MEFIDIHIGMEYGSNKGRGTVTWIDGSTHTIYMLGCDKNDNFEVSINDIVEDLQVHNKENNF